MKEAKQSVFQTRVVFLTLALMVVVLDLVSKRLIVASFQLHEVRQIFGDWVRLTYIHNPGAAFGLFPGSPTGASRGNRFAMPSSKLP